MPRAHAVGLRTEHLHHERIECQRSLRFARGASAFLIRQAQRAAHDELKAKINEERQAAAARAAAKVAKAAAEEAAKKEEENAAAAAAAAARAKARQQAIAQSYVSLGNLAIERGDDAAKGGSSETATNFYNQAVADLHSAKAAYTEGFNAEHPKVAWALEGLAKVHLKLGELAEAQRTVDEALVIRRRIQATDPTKEMFRKELDSCVKLHEEILRTGRQMV